MGWDSLVLANSIELLGGGVASTNPNCLNAMFRLQPGADPGAPQPTTDFVASLLLDGERPFGRRASNRTIKLPIWITAPDRRTLAAAREVLQQAIDQDFFTAVWTRDPSSNPGGTPLPLVFDCFRAQPTVPIFNSLREKQLLGLQVEITIPALPYGRSDTQTQVSFSAPVPTSPSVPPPPAPVVLDTFSAISSTQVFQSTQCVVGPFTACWDPDRFGDPGGQETEFTYGSTFPAPLNLANMTSLQFWFGLGSRWWANLEYHGKIHGTSFYFTLTDTSENTLSFSRSNLLLPVSQSAESPNFTRVTVPIPQGSPDFSYNAVASYSLTVINRSDRVRRLSWVTAYLDNLTALPGSQQVNPVVRGAVYTLYGVQGTARAPVSMSFQQAPVAGTPTVVTATGAGTYTVPANTAWLKVEAWGGGGAGAGMTAAGIGAGGGGAEYAAETVFSASVGQVIPYVVGAGDTAGASPAGGQQTVFGPAPGGTLQVTANGGGSVPANGTAAGAGGSGSGNAVEHPGGAGRANPAGTFGGGGGSSGGDLAAGNTPIGSGSVTFTTAGSNSWTCPAGVFEVLAECWGGGGAGGGSNSAGSNGTGGGGGEYRSGLVPVTPGSVYSPVVGTGGAGVAGNFSGGNGTRSSFTGDGGVQVAGNPGTGGSPSPTSRSPSNGGTGGTGTAGFAGGHGGPAYPYVGGGGSSAGPSAAGNNGGSPGGAVAPTGGGAGGNSSGAQFAAGSPGTAPGGGGGGSWNGGFSSGAGAAGQVRLTFPASTGAPTAAGGAAVDAGGAGGNGGGSAGSAGSAGAAPGGGGGGAFSSGTTLAGGAGAHGQLKITPFAPAAFKSLIVHRPPLGATKTFQPLVSVGAGADPPDGTHQYTMPQPVTGVNADFSGTYSIYLVASSFQGSTSTARTITVTVTQFEFAGGPGYSVSTLPVSVAPNQVANGIVTAGVLTLPVKAVAPDNVGGYYTVSVTDSNTSDRFLDCIFLDTQGQTVVINEPSSGYLSYYLDAPDPNVSLGRIMGSQGGRPDAISVMDNTPYISGGPLFVEPADSDNQLFVYSADGSAPNVSLGYYPCFYFDRV